ncbi:N-acetyl-D-Glu racemase DgcA [Caenispirillum bisanense]|uniref:Dipeptide epimerase n=1 Tax=Caenispirillum bisanense TaxID=414052 RepID=A0A286GWD8_9PROT|nr:N-acetyl-D-Glu racemase DgcA [Caenispirillum bisanense]SOD99867.1 L-alanine-DL-glutamate epimerase [Caenispirillum bisanense]
MVVDTRPLALTVAHESWPITGSFTIARGSKTSAEVVVVGLSRGPEGPGGRGECVPYPRYGETVEGVMAAIEALRGRIAEPGFDRAALQGAMKAGAARNALDCALWDLEAKETGVPAWRTAGVPEPKPLVTAETIGIGTPDEMAAKAARLAARPLLKVKVGADLVVERVRAVRAAAPTARMIVDANEGWTPALMEAVMPTLADLAVDLIEQPLPAGQDDWLRGYTSPVPLCADESLHTTADVGALADRYQVVNIKLDKTGGLTEALRLRAAAREAGLGIMVGCMVGTSLAMAPAALVAHDAEFVDLDGPLLLARDRPGGISFDNGTLFPPAATLWG